MLDVFRKTEGLPEWSEDTKRKALISEGFLSSSPPRLRRGARGGVVGRSQKVLLLQPQTFMNESGKALKNLQLTTHNLQQGKKKIKEIANLAVIHDDLDIPFGKYKISYNKSSGGHHGVESIMKAVKTEAFVRVRVGIASSASAVKKSQAESVVEKTILGKFSPAELTELKKLAKNIAEGLYCLITESREKAMSQFHA